jgi:signal transduction histidine kinase
MVENLLDFSAFEAGKLAVVLKPVRIAKTVSVVLNTLRAVLAHHVVHVEVPEELECLGDHEGLDRILRNLVANAAKYSERGRTITVSAAIDDADGRVRIDVTDEGVGIAPEEHALVFERLYRGPGAAFAARGTGVGLSMVKRYAELMGGSVSVRSEVGKGSTFTVHLAGIG